MIFKTFVTKMAQGSISLEIQGYLAHKTPHPPPKDHHRALGMSLRSGPREALCFCEQADPVGRVSKTSEHCGQDCTSPVQTGRGCKTQKFKQRAGPALSGTYGRPSS
jgi:hypothetical protein